MVDQATSSVTHHQLLHLVGIGPALIPKLHRLGIETVANLYEHVPRRYEDWTAHRSIKSLHIGESEVVIQTRIVALSSERSPRRRLHLTTLELEDETGRMIATWFNQPYLVRVFRVGETRFFRGTVGFDAKRHQKQLSNPSHEAQPAILAIYPETAGLSSKQFRYLLQKNWSLVPTLPDPLPAEVVREHHLPSRPIAIKMLHQPTSLAEVTQARRRFAFEELFWFAVRSQQLRQTLHEQQAPQLTVSDKVLADFAKQLPFTLTDGQRRAAWQIIQDLTHNYPMNRLLNGDVGTGKTVVAAFASYVAAQAGFQTIWLAPTEILAEQHAQTLDTLLKPFGIPVHLHTSSHRLPAANFQLPTSVLIGTHALLHNHQRITHLGLVIIDEQHRFGVTQRTLLREERSVAGRQQVPHFLSMTATPIPRTLALALYGDLELSVLDESPRGRKTIKTRLVSPADRPKAYQFIRVQVAAGRQVYVVCPQIDEGESVEPTTLFSDDQRKSVTAMAQELKHTIFPDLRIGLLHGRLKSKEKHRVMEAFLKHELDILVATAVIEVGIDVANATVMMIESAERFGLAQLHQLRGRVGRGLHQSFCFLLTDSWSETINQRLSTIESTFDGFALAETDLKLRGPGEFLGTSQSGFPAFKLASLMDYPLIAETQAAAKKALADGLIPADDLKEDQPASQLE